MFLVIDNYDSFTYNLVQYFRELREDVEVARNDAPFGSIDFGRYAGIVLSPGPSHPGNSGITLEVIRHCGHIPILGVCLGMQALAYENGGDIVRAARVMHGKVDDINHTGGALFRGVPERFRAVRYHSLVPSKDTLPGCFEAAAFSSDGEVMAIRHRALFQWGLQFHPESYMTEHGMRMIENFIGGSYEYQSAH
jgi:anthranilate synthase/aminodeoxychorismate synthase-like glutamine amidotransferase